jgi:hypothetical protein
VTGQRGSGAVHDVIPLVRRITAWGASHLMGMLAYSTLSPVVVAYAFLIAGTGGLLVAGLVPMAQDSPGGPAEQILFLSVAFFDRLWSPELSLQENALRVFGILGLVGWLIELVVQGVRPSQGAPPPFIALVRRRVIALGALTLALCTLMFLAMFRVEWAGDPSLTYRVLRGGLTAFAMGGIIFAASVPALVAALGIRAMRGPVYLTIRG